MQLTKVNSSNVDAVGYIEGVGVLLVLYKSGQLYAHPGASAELYAKLMSAPSIGKFVCTINRGVLIGETCNAPAAAPARQEAPAVAPPPVTIEQMRQAAGQHASQGDCSILIIR